MYWFIATMCHFRHVLWGNNKIIRRKNKDIAEQPTTVVSFPEFKIFHIVLHVILSLHLVTACLRVEILAYFQLQLSPESFRQIKLIKLTKLLWQNENVHNFCGKVRSNLQQNWTLGRIERSPGKKNLVHYICDKNVIRCINVQEDLYPVA